MIYKNPLLEKSLHFAARIVKLYQYLTKEKKPSYLSKSYAVEPLSAQMQMKRFMV